MSAVWMRARAELRRRWRAWLTLALLTGFFAGGVMVLAAGARRTHSAYPRFLERTRAADIWVPNLNFGPIWAQFDLDELARHPLIADSAPARIVFVDDEGSDVGLVAGNEKLWRSLNRAVMIDGRLPEEHEAHEVSLPFPLAQDLGVSVGDGVTWPFETSGSSVEVELNVVGIHASAGYFPPVGGGLDAIGTSAFFERYGEALFGFDMLAVRLIKGPAGVPEFREALGELSEGKLAFTIRIDEQTVDVQGSIGLQVTALWLLALITGVSMTLVLGQAIVRQSLLDSEDDATLRALGMSWGSLLAVACVRGSLVALASITIAIGTAVGLSPLFPRGVASFAEIDGGVMFDATAFAIGAAALLVAIVGLTAGTGVHRMRRVVLSEGRHRPTSVARVFGRGRPSAVEGVRFALEPGRGATAVPVRTAIASVALGLATLVGALIFAANIDRLIATPHLYGEVWDTAFAVAQTGMDEFPDVLPIGRDISRREDLVAVAAGSRGVPVELDSTAVEALAVDQLKRTIMPPLLEGGLPSNDHEIIVGPTTLRRIGKGVGSTATLSIQGIDGVEVTIVGVGVLPPMGVAARFGEGVFMSYELLREAGRTSSALSGLVPPPDEVYVVYADGVDHAVVGSEIKGTYRAGPGGLAQGLGPEPASIAAADIVSFGRVPAMPFVLVGMPAALAIATMAHVLVSSIHRRRREIAVLRTLGFVRRQVRATVRWQSAAFTITTCLIGLPLGIAMGRWGWLGFARSSGFIGEVFVPRGVLLVGPGALFLAFVVAALPARTAARTQPALVLRSE